MEDPNTTAARPAASSALERLRNRDKVVGSYTVVLKPEWADERVAVLTELESLANHLTNKQAKARHDQLTARLAELEEQRGDAVLEFKFRHCSPVRYETLLSEHRPTDDQREQAKGMGRQSPNWAPSFRPAFIHEVLVEPELTEEVCYELFGEASEHSLLTPGEAAELFTAALMASNTVRRFEKQ